jgi:hypothetical protein
LINLTKLSNGLPLKKPQCDLAIYIKKYVKAKEELLKLQYFIMKKNIIFKKNPLKETKFLQDITTL